MWIEDLNPIIALIGYVYVTGTVNLKALRPDEIAVSATANPPFAQEGST